MLSGFASFSASAGALPQYNQESQELKPSTGEAFSGILQQYIQNKTIATQLRSEKAKADQEEIRAMLMGENLQGKSHFP